MATPTVLFEFLAQERVLVVYQGLQVADEDWSAYVRAARTAASSTVEIRNLVFAEGPPAKKLTDQLAQAVRGSTFRTAVVSPSTATRFVVSALSLLNRHIRCFAPAQLSEALQHIGCSASERDAVAATFHRLCEQGRGPALGASSAP